MTEHRLQNSDARLTVYLDAPDWDGRASAAIGEFSCKSVPAGVSLLEQACELIKHHGIVQVLGPMDGDTWHSYRFVTKSDNSDAFLLEPKMARLELDALRAVGFGPVSDYFSARVPLEQAGHQAPSPNALINVETWDGADAEALFTQVFQVSVKAFSRNAFYKPISLDQFLAMYLPIVPLIKKELVFFARDPKGDLVGFLFGIPNYAEGPNPETAILKTYASLQKGVGQHLAYAFHNSAKNLGYTSAIHALIHSDNLSALRSSAEGAEVFREYTLFGKRLNG